LFLCTARLLHAVTFLFGLQAGPTTIDAAQTSLHIFPPTTLLPSFSGTQMGLLPTYTATGKVTTLFAPTFAAAPTAAVGSGWNNSADTALAYV
jgi:hypothetical protein